MRRRRGRGKGGEREGEEQEQLEVRGRARHEAARRRKSEWKVNLAMRNFSHSNGSWQITPKTVSFSTVEPCMDLRQLTVVYRASGRVVAAIVS